MLPQLADLDVSRLSQDDRDALLAAYRIEVDGEDDTAVADSLGITVAELAVRVEQLRAHWREQAGTSALRNLTDDEYEALRESIREHGQLVEILADVDGNIFDGRARARACRELEIEPRIRYVDIDAAAAKSWSVVLNLARRQLSTADRRGIIRDELLRDASRSDRKIAIACGSTHPTVAAVRHQLEASGDVEKLSTRTDVAGRSQPASKPERPPQKETELPDGLVDVTLRLTREYAQQLDGGAWLDCGAVRLVLVGAGTYTLEVKP